MGFKPSGEEQKWAGLHEIDVKKEFFENLSLEEREELKELHWKKCPKDGIDLIQLIIEPYDVMIDKCIICGGVWIDRVDLEKLLQSMEKPGVIIKTLSKILNIEISKYE